MDKNNTIIRIREQAEQDGTFSAMVSFDHGPEYPITVRDPFTKEQEQELEWYFEEHLRFPFTKKVRANDAAKSIITYGETLFQQVFQDNPKINFPYMSAVQKGLDKAQIEIAGSPKFHALHWEALKDPDLPKPLALQATMVRQNLESANGTGRGTTVTDDQPAHCHRSSVWSSGCWLSHHFASSRRNAASERLACQD